MRGAMSSAPVSLSGRFNWKHSAVEGELPPEILARRARQRRQLLDMTGVSYMIDAAILLIYAYAGTTSFAIASAYAACGLLSVAIFIAISEARINDRFRDHYFILQQTSVSLAIMLGLLSTPTAMARYMSLEAWYVLSTLLSPLGYVIQDVVADAMTVEAVPVLRWLL